MHCRVPAGTFATLLLGLLACPSRAEELPPSNPALEPIYQKLKTLFQRYYPEAVSHLRGDKIHFDHDTRFFTVQTFRKDGGWQDPRQEQGPNPGGVLCELLFGTGIYAGATSAPHSFKRPEYEILFLAPDSPKRDSHLHVRLFHPSDASEEFLTAFRELIESFSR